MYREILESGIANVTALAERIKPDIETKMKADVNTNTIVAALKRLSEHMLITKVDLEPTEQFNYDIKMSLDDSIIDLDFEAEKRGEVMSLFDEIMSTDDISFFIQTSKKCNVFTKSTRLYDVTKQLLSQGLKNPLDQKFSTVTLNFLAEEVKDHLNNLMFEISKLLHSSGIKIHSAFFTPSEIVLNLSNADAIKLYEMLQTDFTKNKKPPRVPCKK